eukprot:355890-Chlamydomonas_euryale.AAC.3
MARAWHGDGKGVRGDTCMADRADVHPPLGGRTISLCGVLVAGAACGLVAGAVSAAGAACGPPPKLTCLVDEAVDDPIKVCAFVVELGPLFACACIHAHGETATDGERKPLCMPMPTLPHVLARILVRTPTQQPGGGLEGRCGVMATRHAGPSHVSAACTPCACACNAPAPKQRPTQTRASCLLEARPAHAHASCPPPPKKACPVHAHASCPRLLK